MKFSWFAAALMALCSTAEARGTEINLRHLQCVAHVVYGESRNEPLEGKFLVAWTVLLRAAANLPEFGGSDICNVAYMVSVDRRGKVTWQYDGAKVDVRDDAAWEEAVEVAERAMAGEGQPNLPIMYFCSLLVRGACNWHDRGAVAAGVMGNHMFYTDPRFTTFTVTRGSY